MNISKKGTDFCPAGEIEPQAKLIFDRLKEQNYFKGLPHDAFVEEITDFYCTTNYLHPFREGNGRTQRAFLTQLTRIRSLSPLRGNPATSSKKQHPAGCCFRAAEKPVIARQSAPRSKCPWGTDWRGNPSHLRAGCHTRL